MTRACAAVGFEFRSEFSLGSPFRGSESLTWNFELGTA